VPRPAPIFPDSAVVRLDAFRASLRVDTCRIRRRSTEPNLDGTESVFWLAPGPPVPCKVRPDERLVQEGSVGFREDARERVSVRLPRDTEVDQDDRIDHDESGLTFDVLNDPQVPTFGFELICRCATTDLPQEDA
jgi:hypothetical protein